MLLLLSVFISFFVFFFNDTATTEIYTLSLHDALPICICASCEDPIEIKRLEAIPWADRKSTRLNSSHGYISYAVFCLKKKKQNNAALGPRHGSPGRAPRTHRRTHR